MTTACGEPIGRGLPRPVEALLAFGGLVVTAPLLVLAALAVRLSSRGPVLFRQQRLGRGGKPFTLCKFRSMVRDRQGPAVTAGDDRRITAVGRILRRTKIDELPELWCVLVGEMSLVGPRPEVPEYVDLRDPLWQKVLEVRPGLTDPVTLRLRHEEELLATVATDREDYYRRILLPFKLRGYLEYLATRTAGSDLGVLASTLVGLILPGRVSPPGREEIEAVAASVTGGEREGKRP